VAGSPADRVVLYRCRTPTNRLCACGRVARALAREGFEVEERRMPWRRSERDEVDALTGQRVVPVVVLGREAICDSRRILEHLRWLASARLQDERQKQH
jgi:glutaredoxin